MRRLVDDDITVEPLPSLEQESTALLHTFRVQEPQQITPTDSPDLPEELSTVCVVRLAACATGCYMCVYGLKKPWAASQYEGFPRLLGVHPKMAMAIAQLVGYVFGKMWGVGLVAKVRQQSLRTALLLAGSFSAASWAIYALLPFGAIRLVAVSMSAFPLATCWSLLYRYVEGRRCSDAVGGVLGSSIVLGGGVAKLVGSSLLPLCDALRVSEADMPMLAAVIFLPLFVLFVRALDATPPPSPQEVFELGDRSVRVGSSSAVGGTSLFSLLRQHGVGLGCIGLCNALLVGARELRDVFQPELWMELYAHEPHPSSFLATELPATLLLCLLLPALSAVRSPRRALVLLHGLVLLAALALPLLGALRTARILHGSWWFALLGAALYTGSIAISSCFFDRLVSAMGLSGSAAPLIQAVDAIGYFGSPLALGIVELSGAQRGSLLPLAERLFNVFGPCAALCTVGSALYWYSILAHRHSK